MTLSEVDHSRTQPLAPVRPAPAPFGAIPSQRALAPAPSEATVPMSPAGSPRSKPTGPPRSEPTRPPRSEPAKAPSLGHRTPAPGGWKFTGLAILTGCALFSSMWGTVVTSRADAAPASEVSASASGAGTAKVLPAQVGAITPPAAPQPVPGRIGGEGVYGVGPELPPGTYRTAGPSPAAFDNCYWERSRDTSGQQKSVIASGLVTGPATVTIKPTDRAFKSSGCQTWTKVR